MSETFKIVILFLAFQIVAVAGFSQRDSTTKAADSLENDLLVSKSKQLRELETGRLQDSLKKVILQKQINELPDSDNSGRRKLLKGLENLESNEAQRLEEKQQKIDSLRTYVKGFPVVPFLNDTLFSIYNKIGSLSARERAEAITTRIRKIADDFFFQKDSLRIVPLETSFDIVSGETIIMSVSEIDGLWQNVSTQTLAEQYKTQIRNAIISYNKAKNWQTIVKEIGLAIGVILLLSLLIYLIIRFSRFTKAKIISQRNKHLKGFTINNYELLSTHSQVNFLSGLNTFIKWFVIVTVVYLTLPILFSIFPWTKGFADTLFSYFLNPLKNIFRSFWNYLPNLFTIIVILLVFRYVLKGIHFFKTEIETGALQISGFYPDWAKPTFQIIKVLVYAFMFIVVFPYLPGSDSPVFQGVSVFLGVLFTFGSSGSLSNVIAGLVITYMRAFKIGDRVKIGDVTGDIIEKTLLVTRIRTIKNEIISVPNSNVMSSHTINYSSDAEDKGLIMHTTVTIGYDVPWKSMHQALIEAASRTESLLSEPKPFVLQTSLEDFYVAYQINAYTREPNKQAVIYSQLHQNIQDCCNEAGIEILSPHYRAARDGNMTTIPESYLAKDYKVPSFKVKIEKDEE